MIPFYSSRNIRLSANNGFVTAGVGEVREESVLFAFRDYKPVDFLFSQVQNLGMSEVRIAEVGGTGRVGTSAPTITFDYDRLGSSIFYAFTCNESMWHSSNFLMSVGVQDS
jgi:hypothetical protein